MAKKKKDPIAKKLEEIATNPEVTESEVTESEVTESEVTESEVTESEVTESETTTDVKKKEPKVLLNIIRGRMPLLLVHAIKFLEPELTAVQLAARYHTTAGKIADIRESKNFKYITEVFKPDVKMIEAAKERCALYDAGDEIKAVISKVPIATAQEMAEFLAYRISIRPNKMQKSNEELAKSTKKRTDQLVKSDEVSDVTEVEIDDPELSELLD